MFSTGSIILAQVRTALQKKTKLKQVNRARFTFNYKEDKLIGYVKGQDENGKEHEGENNAGSPKGDQYGEMLCGSVKKAVKYEEIFLLIYDIDYINRNTNTKAYYFKNGQKLYHEENQKF